MKKSYLILIGLLLIIAACASPTDEIAYETDLDDCLPHETYDPETDTCGVDIACETEDQCDAILSDLYADYEDIELEYWEMLPEDCLDGELYDEDEAVCYIECDSDEDCAAKSEDVYQGADVYYNDDYAGHADRPDSLPSEEDNSGGIPAIARYELDENLDLELVQLDENVQESYSNQERHQEIWNFLSKTLPKNVLREELKEYHVFTDGPSETLAYVSPLAYDRSRWLMGVDIEDTGVSGPLGGELGLKELIHTTVHEFAHIVTLENDQVPPDMTLDPDAEQPSEGELNCQTFYPGEGCALPRSYINLYFQRFWADIYPEYDEWVNYAADEDEQYENTAQFYQKYEDRFVSEYAGTNPGEDIAESFTFFVLKAKPTGDSIADEKVRFFYNFPQLVKTRNYIRSQVARIDPS